MTQVREISTSLVQARSHSNGDHIQNIDLTPWDLRLLPVQTIQKGILLPKPKAKDTYIQHLKHSLSSTLDFFFPFSGCLSFVEHGNDIVSVSVSCNNTGVLFIHAMADNVTLSHILDPAYVPRIVNSFFPLNGSKDYEGDSKPLLAIQVTELVDGVFIGCSANHSVVDGTSFWHFLNSWAEISRGLNTISKLPCFQRWFPEGTQLPIRFPFVKEEKNSGEVISQLPIEKVFHFTRENLVKLKSKANVEASSKTISSLQALLCHVWRYVVLNQSLDPKEDVSFCLPIGARTRILHPPLVEGYFGNALHIGKITMKAEELLKKGIGYAAMEMNKMVYLHTEERLKGIYRSWIENPDFFKFGGMKTNTLVASSSPWFDVYGNDFGWGKPLAVRSGPANKSNGKITLFAGAEEGSIDIQLCLPFQMLEAVANDPDFMAFVSM